MQGSAKVSGRSIERPDDAEVYWESRGEGPGVLLIHHVLWSHPGLYAELIADLAHDHRVITYDPRGCGRSSRVGPYDIETDTADLAAVLEDAGAVEVVLCVGAGFNRVVRVAADPRLINWVVALAPAPATFLPREELRQVDVMGGSDAVVEMLLQLMRTDPRKALHTIIGAANPELDEQQLHERVDQVAEYLDAEGALVRSEEWLEDDISKQIQALGDRLLIVAGGSDPIFEGALGDRVREMYPQARIEQLDDGPISRPDLSAKLVRELTASA